MAEASDDGRVMQVPYWLVAGTPPPGQAEKGRASEERPAALPHDRGATRLAASPYGSRPAVPVWLRSRIARVRRPNATHVAARTPRPAAVVRSREQTTNR